MQAKTVVGGRISERETYNCPLIARTISQGECMDIQHVHSKLMRRDNLVPMFDDSKASALCPGCPYNQMG